MFDLYETRDKGLLRGLLAEDSVASAYLLGDLVEPFFSQCRWLVASYQGRLEGVVLLYTGLSVPALLSHGAPDAVAAVLVHFADELPPVCYAKLPIEHEDAVSAYYRSGPVERLWVMGLRTSELIEPATSVDANRLSKGSPLERIESLYRDYPGNYFEASQLESGMYFGAHAAGRLVSIAGTHVLAPAEGIAVIGNVVTATSARRSGYATACTARLVKGLAAVGCRTVALQVAADNASAITCYRKLGFRFRGIVLQTRCERAAAR